MAIAMIIVSVSLSCQAWTSLPTATRTYLDESLSELEASGGRSKRSYVAAW
jgi:hypothetical protein